MSEAPEYITAGGEIIALRWTRLKTPAEVDTAIPTPPARTRPGIAHITSAGQLVSSLTQGEGFDRKQVEMRSWAAADDPHHLLRRAGHDLWPPAPGEAPIPVLLDRHWDGDDLALLEAASVEILERHDFPARLTWPRVALWAWVGDDLCWAEAPDVPGRLSDHDPSSALAFKPWVMFRTSARFAATWPRWGPFQWAEEVRRSLARRAAALEQVPVIAGPWAEGLALGGYLAEELLRRRFGDDLLKGERYGKATQAGAHLTNQRQRRAREVNKAHAIALATESLNGKLPEGRRSWTLGLLAEEVSAGWRREGRKPQVSTIRDYLREAQDAGDLGVSPL